MGGVLETGDKVGDDVVAQELSGVAGGGE